MPSGARGGFYFNIWNKHATRVLHSLSFPINCSLQASDQLLEPGTVTELEQPPG
ncbi:MAG TPA: hypothetical protein V6D06_10155 [Trichocoleus sp.]